jgi:hypothetical protein
VSVLACLFYLFYDITSFFRQSLSSSWFVIVFVIIDIFV